MNENVKCKYCGTINNVYNGICESCGRDLDVTASETVDYSAVDKNIDYNEFNRYDGFTADIKDERTVVQKIINLVSKVLGTILLVAVGLVPLLGQLIVYKSMAKTSTKALIITFSLLVYAVLLGLDYAVSKDMIDLIGINGTELTVWEYIKELPDLIKMKLN